MSGLPAILDTDPGIDDALALEYLLARGVWDLKAITVVAGNVGLKAALANARGLCALLGMEREVPVYAGCPKPLLRPLFTAERVHGERGVGGAELPEAEVPPREEHAAQIICDLARRYEGELTLIAIGPLTNVAAALILDPTLPHRLKHLVFMGGAAEVPGNVSPDAAEFNIYVDPEAAKVVVESGVPYTMVGLDVTGRALLEREQMEALEGDAAPLRFARHVLEYYMEAYRRSRGREACALHDPLAVAVAEDPGWVETRRGNLYVETRGEFTRGKTSFVPLERADRKGAEPLNPAGSVGEVALATGREGFPRHFVETLGRYADDKEVC
jgi:inosine-uridine nucleoside N-ribohydrolase